jgi:hypothetical protein
LTEPDCVRRTRLTRDSRGKTIAPTTGPEGRDYSQFRGKPPTSRADDDGTLAVINHAVTEQGRAESPRQEFLVRVSSQLANVGRNQPAAIWTPSIQPLVHGLANVEIL